MGIELYGLISNRNQNNLQIDFWFFFSDWKEKIDVKIPARLLIAYLKIALILIYWFNLEIIGMYIKTYEEFLDGYLECDYYIWIIT